MKIAKLLIPCALLMGSHLVGMPADQVEHSDREKFMEWSAMAITDPMADENKDRCAFILKFASESPDVSVEVSKKSGVVWVSEKSPGAEKYSAILLCAYIAGNARRQLERNEKKPNVEAGVQAAVLAYKKIREKSPKFRLKSLDALAKAAQEGRLPAHLGKFDN